MLNFLKKAIQDPAFSDSIRHVMEGSLPNSLKHIISNAEYYGPSLFLLATDVVTAYVFQVLLLLLHSLSFIFSPIFCSPPHHIVEFLLLFFTHPSRFSRYSFFWLLSDSFQRFSGPYLFKVEKMHNLNNKLTPN